MAVLKEIITGVGEDTEKRELSEPAGRDGKWYHPFAELCSAVPFWLCSAVPFLRIYPREVKTC